MDCVPSHSRVLSRDTASVNTSEIELIYLIAKYLSVGPCKKSYEVLKAEIEENKILPKRIDWLGNEHDRTYNEFDLENNHVAQDYLLQIVSRLEPTIQKLFPTFPTKKTNLLGRGSQSLLRSEKDSVKCYKTLSDVLVRQRGNLIIEPSTVKGVPNATQAVIGREICGSTNRKHFLTNKFYSRLQLFVRNVGHLSAIYCMLFDRCGRYIITGADDMLVKIWSVIDGRLVATLRGASAEISDLALDQENVLLAAGSCDKIIRVWCLQTLAPVAVLSNHSGMITALQFCPASNKEGILVSTGGDGCVVFWTYSRRTMKFNLNPLKLDERVRPYHAQLICASFTTGGRFLAVGGADHYVRVYKVGDPEGVEKLIETEIHTDRVDSIQWCHSGVRFVSGSRDGTALIWHYQCQQWKTTQLNMRQTLTGLKSPEECAKKLQVTMVGWDRTDSLVITASSDHLIRVWDSHTGVLKRMLEGHEDNAYVIEAHPTDDRLILTAGHDGLLFIWDVIAGIAVKSFKNSIEGQGHGALFDAKWSPDGLSIATTDSHGHILLFGIGHNELFKKIPQELFFHTDYRPLVRDVNHHVLDEQTQMAPHLMPPPFLVNVDGDPYPPEFQRLVPGREKCRMDQLIPNVVTNDNGEQEVLDLGMGDLEPAFPPPSVRVPNEVVGDPNHVANGGAFGRPNIDDMIERLAQQHVRRRGESERGRDEEPGPSNGGGSNSGSADRRGSTSGGGAHADLPWGGGAPGFDPLSPRSGRVGARREGDIEGVRQSTGNWQRDPNMKWKRQLFLAPLTDGALERSTVLRKVNGEMEMATYEAEAKKRPELSQAKTEDDEGDEKDSKKNRRRQRKTHAYSTRANGGTEPRIRRGRQTGPRIPTAQSAFGADFEDPDAAIASQEREEEEEDALSSSSSSSCSVAKEALEEEESSSSESDNSTDYSDWTADFGGVGLEPPKRTAHKQKKNPVPVKRKKRRKKKEGEKEESDEGEEEEEEEKVVKRKRRKRGEKEEERRPSNARRKRDARCLNMAESDMEGGDIDEIPPEFRPPEWLGETVPKKAPYFPQMGDEIMYFRQGHQLYVEAVITRQLYPIDKRSLPWIRKHNLRDQEYVKIIGIKYEIKPPRLCCLKLGIMDLDGVLTGDSFTIKYHDMPDVLDFLVLKNTYDAAVSRNWQRNDRFRCIIDDAWWIGTVESQEPHLPEFPDSMFMCYRVLWDNGERERLSPWDMEFIDEQMELPDVGGSIQVCPDEYKNLVYTPSPEDWAGSSFESECQRMAEGIGKIMSLSAAEPFLAPVDLNVYPNYAMIVEYHMDLSTIKSRLESHFYRRPNAAQFDVRYIATNAEKFNKKGSVIVKHGRIITDLALRLIKDPTCRDPTIYYHEVQNNYQSPSHSEDETKRRVTPDSERKSGRRKSGRARETVTKSSRDGSIVLPKNLIDDRPWQQQCRDLLKSMFERQDSVPFRFPVDANRYEDYYQVIDVPMDLSTIREELSAGGYDTPRDFAEDVRLVFQNSKNYNTNNRSRIYSMTVRLEAFFEDQIKGILMRLSGAEARAAALMAGPSGSGSNTNGSRPYDESDADEDDDDDGDALRGSVNEGGKRRSRRVAKLRQLKTNDSEETDSDDEEYSPLKRNPHKGQPRHGVGPSSSKGLNGRKSVSPPTPAEKREKGGPVKRTAATKKVRDDNDSDFEVPGKRTSSTPSLRPKKVRRYEEDSDLDSKGPSPPPASELTSEEDEDLVRKTSPSSGIQRALRASAKKYIKSESSSENEEEVGVEKQNGEGGQAIAASSTRRIESSEEEEEEEEAEVDEEEKTYVNGTKEAERGEWSIVKKEEVEDEIDEEEEKGDESEEEEDEGQEDEEDDDDDDDEEEEDKRTIVSEPRQRLTLASFGGRKQKEESEFECDDEDLEAVEDEEEEDDDDEDNKKKKKKKGGLGRGGRVGARRIRPKAIDGDDVEDDVDFVADDFIDDDEASSTSSSSSSSSDDSNPESRRRKPKAKKARKLTQKEKEKRSEQAKKERAKRAKALAREKAKAARAKEKAREKAKKARQKERERERARKEKEEAKAKAKEKKESAKIGRGSGKKSNKKETSLVNSRVSVPASLTAQEVLQSPSSVLHQALQSPQPPRIHQSPIAPQMHHGAFNSQMQQGAAVNPQIHYTPIRPQIHHSPMNPQIIHSPPPSQVYQTPSSPQVHSSTATNQIYQPPVATRIYQGPVVSQTHFSPTAQQFPQPGVMSPMHQSAPSIAQQQYMVPVSTYSSMTSYVPIAVNPHQATNSVSSQPPTSYSAPSSLPQMALAFDSRTQAKQVIHGGRVIGTKITQLGPVSESSGIVTGSSGVATGSSGVATGSSTSGSDDDDDDFEPGTSYHNTNGSWSRTRTRRGRIEDDSEEEDEVGRRGRVRKRVRYNEDSEEGEASNSVSSRGRVRKANTRMRDFI